MWNFLNNASVAAFFGAFFAFLLVMASSWLKRKQLKSTLTALIADNLDQARLKRKAVQANIQLVQEDGSVTDAPFMRFPVAHIREYQVQVLELLTAAQNQSIHALLFWMEQIDDLLSSATTKAAELKSLLRSGVSNEQQKGVAEQYLELMRASERNLGYLCQLCEYFVDRRPDKILDFQHPLN